MKRLFAIVLFCVLGSAGKSFALSPCPPPPGVFHLCFGSYTYSNGAKYVGEWKHRKQHGQGMYTHANGDKYVGEWKDSKTHGQITYTNSNGDKYVGEFKDDKKHGQGTYTWADGDKYVGEFKDDEAWKGVEYDKGGKERFIYRIGIRLPKLW